MSSDPVDHRFYFLDKNEEMKADNHWLLMTWSLEVTAELEWSTSTASSCWLSDWVGINRDQTLTVRSTSSLKIHHFDRLSEVSGRMRMLLNPASIQTQTIGLNDSQSRVIRGFDHVT